MSLPVSLGPSLNCGYVCATCFKSYNTKGDHRCTKRIECGAYCQKECPDFLYAYPRGLKASQRCHDCGRGFFGDTCFEAHRTKTREEKTAQVHQQSICFTQRRCAGCFKLEVGVKNIQRHRCGLHGFSFLSLVRRRSNPSLLHSESPHPSRNPRAKKETKTLTSTRSP